MSRLTKVSKHRQGSVKFGTRAQADDWDPTVKTWKMTPEELEAYKNKGAKKMSDKKTKSLEEYNTLLKQFEERGDLVEELQATVEKYEEEVRLKHLSLLCSEEALEEMKSKYSTVEREQRIAEENLTAANKSLRGKEAQVEQLERELSYARENERTLRENEQIFRTALKAAL